MRIIALARALAASVCTLCVFAPAGAGTNQFTLIGPEGGGARQVQFHPTMPSVAYALTNAGFYRTTDAGLNWQLVGQNLNLQFAPEDFAVDPSDPNRLLVAIPGQAPLVSTDAGATLAHVGNFPLSPPDMRHVEFSADGSVVYGASGVRVVRSTDSGRTWSERTPVTANPASNLQFLRVDPLDANVVYVVDLNQGGFRSTDGGATWVPLPTLPANTFDLAITRTTPQKIWAISANTAVHVSTDNGATWPHVFPAVPAGGVAIALDPQNQSVVYVGLGEGLFRSPDGTNWANVTGNARVGGINSIAINPSQPANLMLGGTSAIFAGVPATSGNGGTWERREHGIFASNAGDLSFSRGSARIYVGTSQSGVHYLAAGSATTTPVDNEALQQLQQSPSLMTTFGLLAQSRATDRLFIGISEGYARSDDGGDTWQLGTTGIVGNAGTVLHFADSPGNPDLILAATAPGMNRSLDGGDTWTPVTAGLPAPQAMATALAFAAASPNTVYAGFQSPFPNGDCCIQHGVYKSLDGGTTWNAANTGFASSVIRALAVDPTNAQVVYAAADANGLLKTTNGGASWSRLDWPDGPGNTLAVALDPNVPSIVYAAGFNVFARSVDAGVTWQPLRADNARPEWLANALLADPRRASTLLASTFNHGVAEITVAPNLVLVSSDTPPSTVAPGAQATYRYNLRNGSAFHATGARAVFTLPTDATGISATITDGSCVVQGTSVTCTKQVLAAAAAVDIVVNATHPVAGTVQVLAAVRGDQPDPVPVDDEVRFTVAVAQPVNPPPSSGGGSSGGGGGGGGTSSLLWVLALAVLRILRNYTRPRRFSTS